jgi:hypothetical protein
MDKVIIFGIDQNNLSEIFLVDILRLAFSHTEIIVAKPGAIIFLENREDIEVFRLSKIDLLSAAVPADFVLPKKKKNFHQTKVKKGIQKSSKNYKIKILQSRKRRGANGRKNYFVRRKQ